jgi:transcriptional regulator with XRE-family HTH domain
MNFPVWLKETRLLMGMDHRTLEERSHLSHGVLTRIENGKSSPMFVTAVRLKGGLDIPDEDFAKEFGVQASYVRNEFKKKFPMSLSSMEVEGFTTACLHDQGFTTDFFSLSKNPIWHYVEFGTKMEVSSTKPEKEVITVVPYPPEYNEGYIRTIAQEGGALIFPDVGPYFRKLRTDRKYTREKLGLELKISQVELYRLETGDMDTIKLSDVVKLLEFVDHDPFFWELCWRAAIFLDYLEFYFRRNFGIDRQSKQNELKQVAYSFVILNRWLQLRNFPPEQYSEFVESVSHGKMWNP